MWQKHTKNRIIAKHDDGFFIIKPEASDPPVPFFCPKCNKKMNKINDVVAFRIYFCCGACEYTNAKSTLIEWKNSHEQ